MKPQVLEILTALAYFRPKKAQRDTKLAQAYGDYTESQLRDDHQSVRHQELIRKNKDKFLSVPSHVGRFVFQNMTRLYMKGWVAD